MPHIHTKPGQHDHTISAFIIRTDLEEPKLLLHKHKLLKKYLQIGGHIELDETPWQAIVHEILEESGYELKNLKILQPKQRLTKLTKSNLHPYPVDLNTHHFSNVHMHTNIDYAFIANAEPSKPIAPGESQKLRWFTRTELAELNNDQTFENIKEIGEYIFGVCLSSWEPVTTGDFEL